MGEEPWRACGEGKTPGDQCSRRVLLAAVWYQEGAGASAQREQRMDSQLEAHVMMRFWPGMLRPLFFFLFCTFKNQKKGGGDTQSIKKPQKSHSDGQIAPSCVLPRGAAHHTAGAQEFPLWSPGGPCRVPSDSILTADPGSGAWPRPSLPSGDTEASVAELGLCDPRTSA